VGHAVARGAGGEGLGMFAHGVQRRAGRGEVGAFGGEYGVAGSLGHAGRGPVRGHGKVSRFSPDGRLRHGALRSRRHAPRPRPWPARSAPAA